MDMHRFDTLARSFASGLSRRSMLGRSARAALVSPLALTEMAAYADGNNKKKDKDRNKDKDRTQGQGQVSGPITVDAPGGDAAASAQTVVQTNNQVCAGNCDQTNQQAVDNSLNQAVLAGSPTAALRPPTYWIDLACAFDAPKYRTVCTGAAQGQEGAPLVQKINLPRDGFCAVVLRTESQPERRETVPSQAPVNSSNNVANAGNGGVANANANGGSVTIGDVRGSNDIAIDASGGNANADASGGDNNVAIAGSQTTQQAVQQVQQVVQPSTVTIELEGNVVPGKPTTYWLDTEAGRRPAAGPSLAQVADQALDTGTIIVDTWTCPTSQPVDAYDWFGQCTSPAAGMQFGLYPVGGSTALTTGSPDEQGRVRFANLPQGTYEVRPEGRVWCHAESDHVDANGNVVVEPQIESHVWTFVCGGGS
ncbi:MAG: hypothetical protein JNM64_16655 [Chloroflexia bacterium]|nr:hypothetical protein [Chloroflexia bacterium]